MSALTETKYLPISFKRQGMAIGIKATTESLIAVIIFWTLLPTPTVLANSSRLDGFVHETTIPILGVTFNEAREPEGVVVGVAVKLETRNDHEGLQIRFATLPGQFSPYSQQAVGEAILRSSRAAGLNSDSWTVTLTLPYWDLTMHGDSLSAMVGLSVVALAKGDTLPRDRVLTGTITEQGEIGRVGGVPYKIQAAHAVHFHRVLIPETYDVADGDWQTPFLMQVSPVGTVTKAYHALTGHSLNTSTITPTTVMNRIQ